VVLAMLCGSSVSMCAAPLRVCADPNNLPYSNDQQQGFENRVADLIAKDLGLTLTYFWFPQREAFFRKTLNGGVCDVVIGVPSGFDEADATRPYYRSTYVFVTRRYRRLDIKSLADPRLRTLRIGVQILGEQDDSLPPVHALISRGIVKNLVGFSIFGNLDEKDPAFDVISAVEQGKVDVAVVWGPQAGYFSLHSPVPLDVTPLSSDPLNPTLPFHFDIAIGVRKGDVRLKETLDREVDRRHAEIDHILRDYGIPQLALPAQTARTKED
jgi:quinoprotein dehydrogenase-associated probable ABC transporter substrate-binding protein